MKIYVDKKPESCGVCVLVNVKVLDVMENREMVLQHFCPLLDLSVDPDNLDDNCQLTELKPKELEWEFDGEIHTAKIFGDVEISFAQFMNGKSKIYIGSREYEEHYDKRNSELKERCKEIRDKLFNEMIG